MQVDTVAPVLHTGRFGVRVASDGRQTSVSCFGPAGAQFSCVPIDSIAGDPITHLQLTPEAHAHAARRLGVLADRFAKGRVLGMGGGGYNRANLANAWTRVVEELAA